MRWGGEGGMGEGVWSRWDAGGCWGTHLEASGGWGRLENGEIKGETADEWRRDGNGKRKKDEEGEGGETGRQGETGERREEEHSDDRGDCVDWERRKKGYTDRETERGEELGK